jgi:hypothetical protein
MKNHHKTCLAFFQPAVSSPAVPWQRLLRVEILQLHALRSSLHRPSYRTHLNSQLTYHTEITPFPLLESHCCIIKKPISSNRNVFTEPLPRNGRCLQSHCLATGICSTLLSCVSVTIDGVWIGDSIYLHTLIHNT